MKNKNMFLNVFYDAFLRLKTAGITFGVISIGLILILNVLASSISGAAFYIISAILPYIITPVLTFIAFNFLFKRKSSDLFHSLPIKRTSLFFANSVAIFSWILILLLFTFIFSGCLLKLLSLSNNAADLKFFFTFCSSALVSSLYVYGICATSIFLTGLPVAAVTNLLAFVFIPNILTFIFFNSLSKKFPFISLYNPDEIINMLIFAFDTDKIWFYLVAGIVLFIVSSITFFIRKSETAGQSAPNNFLRIIYCTLASFLLCLYPIYVLIYKETFNSVAFIFYGLSIVLCFGYSLLTRKGLSGLKNAIISFASLVLLNALFFGAVYGTTYYLRNKGIDVAGFQIYEYNTSETRTVETWGNKRIYSDGSPFSKILTKPAYSMQSYGYYQLYDYFITDKEACNLLEDIYDEVAQTGSLNYRIKDNEKWTSGFVTTTFIVKDSLGRTKLLTLPIIKKEFDLLVNSVTNIDSQFVKLACALPKQEQVEEIELQHNKAEHIVTSIDKNLYSIFYEEMQQLTLEEQLSLTLKTSHILNKYAANPYNQYVFYVRGEYENNDFSSYYILNKNLLPKTYNAFISSLSLDQLESFNKFLNKNDIDQFKMFSLQVKQIASVPDYPATVNGQKIHVSLYYHSSKINTEFTVYNGTNYTSGTKTISQSELNELHDKICSFTPSQDKMNFSVTFTSERNGESSFDSFSCYLDQEQFYSLYSIIEGSDEN